VARTSPENLAWLSAQWRDFVSKALAKAGIKPADFYRAGVSNGRISQWLNRSGKSCSIMPSRASAEYFGHLVGDPDGALVAAGYLPRPARLAEDGKSCVFVGANELRPSN
jgi:hypothetical protein